MAYDWQTTYFGGGTPYGSEQYRKAQLGALMTPLEEAEAKKKQALKQEFLRTGGYNTGGYLGAVSQLGGAAEEARSNALRDLMINEGQLGWKAGQAEVGREWQTGEAEKGRVFAALQAEYQRNYQMRENEKNRQLQQYLQTEAANLQREGWSRQEAMEKATRKTQMLSSILGTVGTIAGGYLGGPGGAAIGAKVGDWISNLFNKPESSTSAGASSELPVAGEI